MYSLLIVAKNTHWAEVEREERKEITIHIMLFNYQLFFFFYSLIIQKNSTYTYTFMHVHLVLYPYLIIYSKQQKQHSTYIGNNSNTCIHKLSNQFQQ